MKRGFMTPAEIIQDAEKYRVIRTMMERSLARLEKEAKVAMEKSEENRPLNDRFALMAMSREKQKAATEMRIILETVDEVYSSERELPAETLPAKPVEEAAEEPADAPKSLIDYGNKFDDWQAIVAELPTEKPTEKAAEQWEDSLTTWHDTTSTETTISEQAIDELARLAINIDVNQYLIVGMGGAADKYTFDSALEHCTKLTPEFDTKANREAIAKRRKELGLS
jgi:hypothetical protein